MDLLEFSNMIIHLDAEDLAEGAIQAAYKGLLPELLKYVKEADEITEVLDNKGSSYTVHHHDRTYSIYASEYDDASWANATYALFSIVNAQLAGSPYRFYAINGGNDLGGRRSNMNERGEPWSGKMTGLTSRLTGRPSVWLTDGLQTQTPREHQTHLMSLPHSAQRVSLR